MTCLYEINRSTNFSVFALPICDGNALGPIRLPSGTIVEAQPSGVAGELLPVLPGCLEVGHGDVPATASHAVLGLVVGFLPLAGIFRLVNGGLVAVYGAEAVPIGAAEVVAG